VEKEDNGQVGERGEDRKREGSGEVGGGEAQWGEGGVRGEVGERAKR